MADEGSILLIAGSETPSKVLALIFYHLLANDQHIHRIREELSISISDTYGSATSLRTLETLPYLTAVILEGLRLHGGIVGRSARIAPHALVYGNLTIPPGTPVSTASPFIHYNEDLFPAPREFHPERWLKDHGKGTFVIDNDLKKYLVAFGKGTRNCLGYNLAMAVLYLTVSNIISQFELQLFETDLQDVTLERDWAVPQPRLRSQGVKVKVSLLAR